MTEKSAMETIQQQRERLLQLIRDLPEANRILITSLLQLVATLLRNCSLNELTVTDLGNVFGPILLYPPLSRTSREFIGNLRFTQGCVQLLFREASHLVTFSEAFEVPRQENGSDRLSQVLRKLEEPFTTLRSAHSLAPARLQWKVLTGEGGIICLRSMIVTSSKTSETQHVICS